MSAKWIFLCGNWLPDSASMTESEIAQLFDKLQRSTRAETALRIQTATLVFNVLSEALSDANSVQKIMWTTALLEKMGWSLDAAAFEVESVSQCLALNMSHAAERRENAMFSEQPALGIILIEGNVGRLADMISALVQALRAGNAAILLCQEDDSEFLNFFITQLGLIDAGERLLKMISVVFLQSSTMPLAKSLARDCARGILLPTGRPLLGIRSVMRILSDTKSFPIEENALVVGDPPSDPLHYEKFINEVLELLKIPSYRSIRTVFTSSQTFADDMYRRVPESLRSGQQGENRETIDGIFSRNALHSRYRILSAQGKAKLSSPLRASDPLIVCDIADDAYCSQSLRLIRIVYRPSFELLIQHLREAESTFGIVGMRGVGGNRSLVEEFSSFGKARRIVAFSDFRQELLSGFFLQASICEQVTRTVFIDLQPEWNETPVVAALQSSVIEPEVEIVSDESAGIEHSVFRIDYPAVHRVVERFGVTGLQIGVELNAEGPPLIRICLEAVGMNDAILWNLQEALLSEIPEIEVGLQQQTIQDMVLELYEPGQLPRDPDSGEPLKFTA